MEAKKLLSRIGLGENASAIYLALLEKGSGTVSDIAKQSGLHRPIVYQELPGLQEHGLVTISKRGKRQVFNAESPEAVERLVEDTHTELRRILPELVAMHQTRQKRPSVKYLEGRRGIQFVLDDLLNSLKRGETFYRYSSARDMKKSEYYLPKDYRERRDRKQLQRFVITSEERAKLKKPRMERAIKTISGKEGLFDDDVTQLVYGDKVAIIDYGSESAIIIENPVIAKFQRNLFRLLYDRL